MTPKPNIVFDALGTQWYIESPGITEHESAIKKDLDTIVSTWSRFDTRSTVSKMSKTVGMYTLSPDDAQLLAWYRQLYDATGGLMTPLIGQTLVDAGYDVSYSLQPKNVIRTPPQWNDAIEVDGANVTIKRPVLIDVGAAGKGYAVDMVARRLGDTYCIDASGDILVHGEPMRIGLQNPENEAELIGVATITNQSICGSAVTKRAWGKWHHIIDPQTSEPVSDIIATWVIADSAMHADGLATALFFVTPERLEQLMLFQYCIVYRDGTVRYAGDSIEIFTEKVGSRA